MSELPRVVITDYITSPDFERRVLNGTALVQCLGAHDTASLSGRLGDATVVMCYHEVEITSDVVKQLRRCVGIIRVGVGFDNIDICAAGEQGIVVCNVPDYGTEEVADHALALLLALTRRIVAAIDSTRRGEWNVGINAAAPRLRNQTVGILGAGRIGTAFALRATAIGMRVVMYDPYVARGYEKAIGIDRAWSLEELLPQCQILSLHCPLTDETRKMLDARRLALLPRDAYVVNTARGGLIDEEALLSALDAGHISGAALDVLEHEPLSDERIRRHPKLLITPHCAFLSAEAEPEMRTKSAEEALRLIRGERPRNPVNVHISQSGPAPGRDSVRGILIPQLFDVTPFVTAILGRAAGDTPKVSGNPSGSCEPSADCRV